MRLGSLWLFGFSLETSLAASTPAAPTWLPVGPGPGGLRATKLIIDPRDTRVFYTIGDLCPSELLGCWGVLKSTDRGARWTSAYKPFYPKFSSLAIDSVVSPSALFVSSNLAPDCIGSIDRSLDGGATWTSVQQGLFDFLQTSPSAPRALYADLSCFASRILQKSSDGGASWQSLGVSVCSLAIAPSNPNIVYKSSCLAVAEPVGLYSSGDGGTTWSFVNHDGKPGSILAVDPRVPATIWAGTPSGQLFRSVDAGSTWLLLTGITASRINDLVIDPFASSTLYVAADTGLYRSTDSGSTWTNIGAGLPEPGVRSVTLDPLAPSIVYAAVTSGGLYQAQFPPAGFCQGAPGSLCLGANRFRLELSWQSPTDGTRSATAIPLSDSTGAFWFFESDNLELVVKVLDGRFVNGHFWVFYGALSNVEYTLTVTDTLSGFVRTYFNPQGQLASTADTSAF